MSEIRIEQLTMPGAVDLGVYLTNAQRAAAIELELLRAAFGAEDETPHSVTHTIQRQPGAPLEQVEITSTSGTQAQISILREGEDGRTTYGFDGRELPGIDPITEQKFTSDGQPAADPLTYGPTLTAGEKMEFVQQTLFLVRDTAS